jgi:predicted Ser/Thr protein kinase
MPNRSREGPADLDRLNPSAGSGETLDDAVTDELIEEEAVSTPVAELGIEARAEYERVRSRLGLRKEQEKSMLVVGRYRLEQQIGHGGMGVVYRAHDPELGRPVAIKLVRTLAFAARDKLRARLLREAKVLAKLTHNNIVRIYDCGHHQGEVFLAMEYVEGRTLREWQNTKDHPPAELIHVYAEAAMGLAAAHDVGIVHRDFKPDNVFVADDGRILVGDFGLAIGVVPDEAGASVEHQNPDDDVNRHAAMTKTGTLLGTLAYMAPEQLCGDAATLSSDQFAFCVSLWEALTGNRPFESEDREPLLAEIQRGQPVAADRLPGKLKRLLMRGLAADPNDRFPQLRTLAEAIRPRRKTSTPVLVAVVGSSLAVGLLVAPMLRGTWMDEEQCPLEQSVADVRESEAWDKIRRRTDAVPLGTGLARLELHLRRLEQHASELCGRPTNEDVEARRQYLQLWVDDLRDFLATAETRTIRALLADLEALEHARLTAPPPRALAEDVVEALEQSIALERRDELPSARLLAELAIDRAGHRYLELAVAHRRHGRVLALQGYSLEALNAYEDAAFNADAASYDDARLETQLLVAKTAIMRRDDLERGRTALREAEGLLIRLREPWLTPRRAAHHELTASVLRREGRLQQALTEQWFAILQRTLFGEVYETGLSHMNLATIHEYRAQTPGSEPEHDLERARQHYEYAIDILRPTQPSPEWLEAMYGFGHYLTLSEIGADWDRAAELLEEVRSHSSDFRIYAMTDLVILYVKAQQDAAALSLAHQLVATIGDSSPVSTDKELDAWIATAMAFVFAGDWPAFQHALAKVHETSAIVERMQTQPAALLATRIAHLALTVGSGIPEADAAQAEPLVRAARERLLALPSAQRPADLIAELDLLLPNPN